MKISIWGVLALAACCAAPLSAAELRLSLGVRETNTAGPVGANGGATGGIEWSGRPNDGIELDVTVVPADGAWHAVSFDLNALPVRGFAGTVDNVLASTSGFGVLEHIRIANTADGVTRYKVYIDDVTNTVNGAAPTLIADFDSLAVGTEHMIQEPRFSGSTSGKLKLTPNVAAVSSVTSVSGANSYLFDFDFLDDTAASAGGGGNWVRLTTNNAPGLPNPTIGVPGGPTNTSVVSMQIKIVAIPEPATLGLAGVALVGLALRRRR